MLRRLSLVITLQGSLPEMVSFESILARFSVTRRQLFFCDCAAEFEQQPTGIAVLFMLHTSNEKPGSHFLQSTRVSDNYCLLHSAR